MKLNFGKSNSNVKWESETSFLAYFKVETNIDYHEWVVTPASVFMALSFPPIASSQNSS